MLDKNELRHIPSKKLLIGFLVTVGNQLTLLIVSGEAIHILPFLLPSRLLAIAPRLIPRAEKVGLGIDVSFAQKGLDVRCRNHRFRSSNRDMGGK